VEHLDGDSDDDWGITDGYRDVHGGFHPTPEATRQQIRDLMGTPVPGRPMWFVPAGQTQPLWSECTVQLEAGGSVGPCAELPRDLPIGYHDLIPTDGGDHTRLVVHPPTCLPLPRMWGCAAQVYALWSDTSWGIGDLFDVRRLAASVVAAGGGAMLLSPLHQPAPTLPQEDSPYYPSSRRAWNPLLLGIDAPVPAHLRCSPDELIDRDEAWISKRSVLEAEFDAFLDTVAGDPDPDAIARWNATSDLWSTDWRTWPDPVVRADADPEFRQRAQFHQWLQTKVDQQLADVRATGITLIGDLAVGFSPNGADASEFVDLLADGVCIGAPPDEFNPHGQRWGIPPFVPWRLKAQLYQPFIDTVRATLRGMGGLRMDHVMGLFRQYWVPDGQSPEHGAYVRFPARDLIAIIAIEATRAGAFVVGEDLGTVEPEVHQLMAEFGIAGTKVLWFEDEPPSEWPDQSLATITTHDLPTLAMVFDRERSDDDTEQQHLLAIVGDATDSEAATTAAHAALLASPAALRLMTTDDLAGATRQPNVPGTTDQPNWKVRLPLPVEQLL
jgi:4-alpha-glucanotransferase